MGEFSSIPKKKIHPLGIYEDSWVHKVFRFRGSSSISAWSHDIQALSVSCMECLPWAWNSAMPCGTFGWRKMGPWLQTLAVWMVREILVLPPASLGARKDLGGASPSRWTWWVQVGSGSGGFRLGSRGALQTLHPHFSLPAPRAYGSHPRILLGLSL